MEELMATLGQGGAIGGGAIGGAWLIIQFIKSARDDIKEELKNMNGKLDEVILGHQVAKAKHETEIEFIKVRLLELDKRIEKLEFLRN